MPQQQAERGMALAMVLVVGLLLSITVMAVLRTVGFRFHSVENQRQRESRFYGVEAGLQAVWIKLQRQLPPFTDPDDPANPWVDTDSPPDGYLDRSETIQVGDRPETPAVEGYSVTIRVNRIGTTPNRFKIQAATTLPGTS